jgi:PadR family transcriptional regulator AphA
MPRRKEPLTLEYALLGFLRAGPAHAYEIHQRLAQTEVVGLVWHLKQRQLYALLERLEAEGYIKGTTEPQGNRPPRRVLALTASGEARFQQWLSQPVDHGRDFRQEFMAKLYFAHLQGAARVNTLIEQQRQVCQQQLSVFQRQLATIPPERPLDRLVWQFRQDQMVMILAWLETCRALLTL